LPVTPPDLTLCESSLGSGTAVFNLIPQTPIVLGVNYSPADYTVTYYVNQPSAVSGLGFINPTNAFSGNDGQTIYVRLEENADPTNFGITSFQLLVNPLPTASISISPATVCLNETALINFTGTPNTEVTYAIDSNSNEMVTLNAAGTASISTPPIVGALTCNLVSVLNSNTDCCLVLPWLLLIPHPLSLHL
jgi:hypothetical protein